MTIETAFIQFPCLITHRLLLRQIQPNDAESLFAIFSDEEAMQYYGHLPHRSLNETHELVSQAQTSYAVHENIRWGIALAGENRVIGTCGFHHFDTGFHRAETGYALHSACWGQGIMTEAMSAVLSYGFRELGLHRIEAAIDDQNTRSKNLLLKLGFSYEGNLRQRYYFNGRFEDEHYYGLLKEDWQRHNLSSSTATL